MYNIFYLSLYDYINSFDSFLFVIKKHSIKFSTKKTCIHVEAAVTHILTPVIRPIIVEHEGRDGGMHPVRGCVVTTIDKQGEAVSAVNRDPENVKWLEIVNRRVRLPAATL